MVQQRLNYSSEHYFYSLFERVFELIHRVSELCCQILVISSHWICKSCGRRSLVRLPPPIMQTHWTKDGCKL